MKVQNGVHPERLRPVQSSEEARKPSGTDESRRAVVRCADHVRSRAAGSDLSAAKILIAATPSAATTSRTKGAASKAGISLMKSMAKRPSKRAAINHAVQNNNR